MKAKRKRRYTQGDFKIRCGESKALYIPAAFLMAAPPTWRSCRRQFGFAINLQTAGALDTGRRRAGTSRLEIRARRRPAFPGAAEKRYRLSDTERADPIQVVEGFTSPHDHEAARRGIEWMREHYRRLGRGPGVLITEAGTIRRTRFLEYTPAISRSSVRAQPTPREQWNASGGGGGGGARAARMPAPAALAATVLPG